MPREIRISETIIPKYLPIFRDETHKHIILTSGRAGTKSSYAAIRAVYQLVAGEKGSVVVLRKHHNKLRKTVYKEMLRGTNRLMIPKKQFKITVSPMEIQHIKSGNTMFFAGSDGIDDTKGIIDEDRPIRLVVLDELTEFFDDGEGADELQNIEATFIRGNAGGFQMLYLYNPPKNPNAAINRWCRQMERRSDTLHLHVDYRDVPSAWLGRDLVDSAEALRKVDERQYRWLWLGEPVGIDELIYYMFGSRHIARPAEKTFRVVGIGGDYGQQNATTFQAFGLDEYGHRLTGLAEYYHSGRESGRQKSPSEYARDFVDFIKQLHEIYKCSYFYLFLDPSARGLQEEIKRAVRTSPGPYNVLFRDAENEVALGISRVQKLLTFDRLSVSPDQQHAVEEFGLYEYDRTSIEKGREVPVKQNDHCMDAIRYMVMGMWGKIKAYLPRDGEKEPEVPGLAGGTDEYI